MLQTASVALVANRWDPFYFTADFVGYDYSAATFAMQVRLYRDAPGDPLVDLANAPAGTEGISVEVRTEEVDGVETPVSAVTIQIFQSSIRDLLPFAVTEGTPSRKAGSDVTLAYDLQIAGGGHAKLRRMEGTFTIKAGVTQ